VYTIEAFDECGAVELGSANTAKEAVLKFLDAVGQHNRVWVNDEAGNELAFDELVRRAEEEGRSS
jgi:hypothetical protein